ncbi:MAG: valine--tRNA ligase [Candidatus Omnitrophica bacterium]|nr:valine--tRNA ligase [Candidatus Omnitrophota bacterium]
MDISPRYNPKEVEDKWYKFWEEKGFFHAEPNQEKNPFCIVIPPPNVTGILHMGHALNNTIQDILIRFKKMQGFNALWIPGTDHAGIATQNVVEKNLAKEGVSRQDLGREKFLEKVWQWRENYGSTIIQQLKKLGASCDWQRTCFTMDDEYSEAVLKVFVSLYEKGLIYRSNYIINWCPRCQTALSDEEAPYKEIEGKLYYIKYPLKEKNRNYVTVATTRPETMLGDTAVAVNPKDKRYKKLIGKKVILPLMEREMSIIADNMVDMDFGTGAVKVTPAHDPNDYSLGKRHKLEFINIMNPDGTMNENAGKFRNLDRFDCRHKVVDELRELGFLEKIESYTHAVGHCYRCNTIIEPYLSLQWFVKMKPLAKPAIQVVKKGKIKFFPPRWTKIYLSWMENIQDWCISRQIWWGHRLPVYYCRECQVNESQIRNPKFEKGIIVSKVKPDKCPKCGGKDIYQDEDVLDTWFSSWLWPFVTLGWPKLKSEIRSPKSEITDLDYFYPTSVLVTAQEIIFFWVARMIMAGLEFMKDIPFRHVYIHGTVRDLTGKKMSKSLGNIIDPLEIIKDFGADALRFSIISITAVGQDVFLSGEKFKLGRNFCNKIWNATRFIFANVSELTSCNVQLTENNLSFVDRWILSRLQKTIQEVTSALEKYNFNEAASLIYQFFWHEFCDWYIEIVKPIIVTGYQQPATIDRQKETTQFILIKVLETSLRLLHPLVPFITEELWQKVKEKYSNFKEESITMTSWPLCEKELINKQAEKEMEIIQEIIKGVRNIFTEMGVPLDKKMSLIFKSNEKNISFLKENSNCFENILRIESLDFGTEIEKPPFSSSLVVGNIEVYIPLEGIIDFEKEKQRIKEKLKNINTILEGIRIKLNDKNFLSQAPKEVIEKEISKREELIKEKQKWEKYLVELQE